MFIKKLWNHNKYAAVFFIFIIGLWLFLNIKQGAVATPLLQFGMYSGLYYKKEPQSVFHIYVNKEKINFSKLSIAERDLIQTSLEMFLAEDEINKTSFITMKRILSKVVIGNLMKKENYLNKVNKDDFSIWFRELLKKITDQEIQTVQVYSQDFVWSDNNLKPASSPDKTTAFGF